MYKSIRIGIYLQWLMEKIHTKNAFSNRSLLARVSCRADMREIYSTYLSGET
jgi:hypothetical protein